MDPQMNSPPLIVEITPNTPAAEALAANNSIKVSKLHKVVRSTRLQAGARVIKSSVRSAVGMPRHAGDRRGDPDFCPPNLSVSTNNSKKVGVPTIEEAEGSESDESENDVKSVLQTSPVTRAALPSAIAAACRAGEDLERRRMEASTCSNDVHVPIVKKQSRDSNEDRKVELMRNGNSDEEIDEEEVEKMFVSIPPPPLPFNVDVVEPPVPNKTKPPIEATEAKKKSRTGLKQFSMKSGLEDSNNIFSQFHFHGPRSVRHWINKRRHQEISSGEIRSYVKGKVIDRQHELFIMSIAIMLGMRTSIGRTNMQMAETSHDERRWLDGEDLMAVEKYIFPPRGGQITPPHQLNHTFKFKDYSPHAFAYLRRMFGVNEYEFLLSVCGNANYIEFQSNAKSGQFFFYSKDGKYMIKTMTSAESKFLRRSKGNTDFSCCVLIIFH